MRNGAIMLAMASALALGCRTSEEAGTTRTAAPPADRESDARQLEPIERDPPPADDADRWQKKEIDRESRQVGRRQAARERDRRIDEAPIEHAPDTPPAQETPPQ